MIWAHAVEHAAQHIAADGQLQGVAQEADLAVLEVDAGGGLEELNHGLVAVDFQHLAATDTAVRQLDLRQLVVGNTLDLLHHHQRAGDLIYGTVFLHHTSAPAFSTMAAISCSISAAISA